MPSPSEIGVVRIRPASGLFSIRQAVVVGVLVRVGRPVAIGVGARRVGQAHVDLEPVAQAVAVVVAGIVGDAAGRPGIVLGGAGIRTATLLLPVRQAVTIRVLATVADAVVIRVAEARIRAGQELGSVGEPVVVGILGAVADPVVVGVATQGIRPGETLEPVGETVVIRILVGIRHAVAVRVGAPRVRVRTERRNWF